MFHTFSNIEERNTFGGTAFIEIQYCRLNADTKLKKKVAVKSIQHWMDDSLYIYVDDIDSFISNYGRIFNTGTYNNMQTGFVDVFGINYYTVDDVMSMVEMIIKEKPVDYQKLENWLNNATHYNGVYLLGI